MNSPTSASLPASPADPSTQSNEPSLLPGVKVLLEGPTGTGKTFALGTLADSGVELFVLFTENALESLLGYWTDRNLPVPPNVHWHILQRPQSSFSVLEKGAATVLDYTQEALYKLNDPERNKHNSFKLMLGAMTNFPDDRTGQKFGPVDKWGPNRCIAISTLTAINSIAMSLVIGNKPIKSQTDWGIAQDQIERFLKMCADSACHFVLEGHVEREVDQVFGGVKITVATLGKALAPRIPVMFSDVILAERKGKEFSWSTINPLAELKTRNLPLADNIKPDFGQIITKWKSRGGRLTEQVKK